VTEAPAGQAAPARNEIDAIARAVEQIPLVGKVWADALQILFGLADAMNLQRLREDAPRRSRDRKVVFLY
jgi:hypothetical protein